MKKILSFSLVAGLLAITFAFSTSSKQEITWQVIGGGIVTNNQIDAICPGGTVECAYELLDGSPVTPPVYKYKP